MSLFQKKSQTDIFADLRASIQQYAKFELDGPLSKHTYLGMHEETVINRASIHDMLEELGQRAYEEAAKVKAIDKEWQQWVQCNKDENFKLIGLNREKEPKTEWWFWIDQLDKLTSKEKQTL